MAKKVLWFSRHEMSNEQKAALGKDVDIRQISATIAHASELAAEIDEADVVAIVAPIGLQQEFLRLADDKPVIMAVSARRLVPNENGGEDKVVFDFVKWERLIKIDVVKEDYIP